MVASSPAPSRARRRAALRADREALIARSAVLREQLATRVEQLEPLARQVGGLRAGWRWLAAHRLALGAGGLALLGGIALVRPHRAWRLARRAWALWRGWRRLRQHFAAAGAPAQPSVGVGWQAWVLPWLARLMGR